MDGMTTAEANRFAEEGQEEFEIAAEKILSEIDLESEFAQSAAKVQADVEANLIAVGQAPENAKKIAQLQKSFAVVAAQKMKTTPEDIVKRFPVMFQSQPVSRNW
jgi:hypothetical protein